MSVRFGGEKFAIDLYYKKFNDFPETSTLNIIKYSGAALYVLGWLLIAYCISMKHKSNKFLLQFLLSAIGISVIWVVMEYKEINFSFNQLPLVSVTVLLTALASLITLKIGIKDISMLMVSSILITFSEYFMLPFQRQHGIQDGIGLPTLILGWFILYSVFNEVKVNEETFDDFEQEMVDLHPMVDVKL
jgi:uncharacterized membrane protein YhdT